VDFGKGKDLFSGQVLLEGYKVCGLIEKKQLAHEPKRKNV